MGLDLQGFLDELGMTQEECAYATRLSQPTVSDLCRRATDPLYSTVSVVTRWAAEIAARKRLPRAKRLDPAKLGRAA